MKLPSHADFNFGRLFFSKKSTNIQSSLRGPPSCFIFRFARTIFDLPRPFPRDKTALSNSPSPGAKDRACPGGVPRGEMITGGIEPYIDRLHKWRRI